MELVPGVVPLQHGWASMSCMWLAWDVSSGDMPGFLFELLLFSYLFNYYSNYYSNYLDLPGVLPSSDCDRYFQQCSVLVDALVVTTGLICCGLQPQRRSCCFDASAEHLGWSPPAGSDTQVAIS